MDKKNVVYIDSEIWGRKKDEILLLAATWMDLEGIMLEEMSRKKEKCCMILLYVESQKQNKWINKTETE